MRTSPEVMFCLLAFTGLLELVACRHLHTLVEEQQLSSLGETSSKNKRESIPPGMMRNYIKVGASASAAEDGGFFMKRSASMNRASATSTLLHGSDLRSFTKLMEKRGVSARTKLEEYIQALLHSLTRNTINQEKTTKQKSGSSPASLSISGEEPRRQKLSNAVESTKEIPFYKRFIFAVLNSRRNNVAGEDQNSAVKARRAEIPFLRPGKRSAAVFSANEDRELAKLLLH